MYSTFAAEVIQPAFRQITFPAVPLYTVLATLTSGWSKFIRRAPEPVSEYYCMQIAHRLIPQGSADQTHQFFRSENPARGLERAPKTKVYV